MRNHWLTVVALLLALSCYVAGLTGASLALFFVGAALEISLWLQAVQPPRRGPSRWPARVHARR